MQMIDHALAHARAGFRVIPIPAGQKGPELPNWQNRATRDESQIRAWWTAAPNGNVGLVMGGPERLIAIDVDGDAGKASLDALEAEHGPLPETLVAETGSGNGTHILFRVPMHFDATRIKNRELFKNAKIDVKFHNGQIVGAGSVHPSGGRYRWLNESTPIAELPQWLYDVIATEPSPPKSSGAQETRDEASFEADGWPLAKRITGAIEDLKNATPSVDHDGRATGRYQTATTTGGAAALIAAGIPWRWGIHGRAARVSLWNAFFNQPPATPDQAHGFAVPTWTLEHQIAHKFDDAEKHSTFGENCSAPPPTPLIVSPLAARVDRLGSIGPRVSTGIETLDRVTRGGLARGSLVVFGGAPGACKTTLVVHQAVHQAQNGIPTAILAADEGPDTILIRIGQVLGLEREAIEQGTVAESFKQRLAGLHLNLFSCDEPGVTAESVAEELAKQGPGVLVIDSLQTVRTKTSGKADDARSRLNDVVEVLKAIARTHKHVILVTSELARAAYRAKDVAAQIDDLAAFKESGAIEYAGTVLLVLRNPRDGGGLVEVTMPKNRLGFEKADFHLQLDPDRATLTEVEDAAAAAAEIERNQTRQRQVWELVRDAGDIRSGDDMLAKLRQRGTRGDNGELRRAFKTLVEDRRILRDKGESFYRAQPWDYF